MVVTISNSNDVAKSKLVLKAQGTGFLYLSLEPIHASRGSSRVVDTRTSNPTEMMTSTGRDWKARFEEWEVMETRLQTDTSQNIEIVGVVCRQEEKHHNFCLTL